MPSLTGACANIKNFLRMTSNGCKEWLAFGQHHQHGMLHVLPILFQIVIGNWILSIPKQLVTTASLVCKSRTNARRQTRRAVVTLKLICEVEFIISLVCGHNGRYSRSTNGHRQRPWSFCQGLRVHIALPSTRSTSVTLDPLGLTVVRR